MIPLTTARNGKIDQSRRWGPGLQAAVDGTALWEGPWGVTDTSDAVRLEIRRLRSVRVRAGNAAVLSAAPLS